jgi:hypothetical protein
MVLLPLPLIGVPSANAFSVAHETLQVFLRGWGGVLSYHRAPANALLCAAPTQWDWNNRTGMGQPSDLNCGLSAFQCHVLRHAKAKADLLEINPGSGGDISTEWPDTGALDSYLGFAALAADCVCSRYSLHLHIGFHRVVAKSKELFCMTRITIYF